MYLVRARNEKYDFFIPETRTTGAQIDTNSIEIKIMHIIPNDGIKLNLTPAV